MNRVIGQNVSKAVENWKNGNFEEVVEFLKSCEYKELVEFGYQVEDNDIDIQEILDKSGFEDGSKSPDVIDALDGMKIGNARRVQTSWSAMNDSETLSLGVNIKRCNLSLDEFFDMINS
jgi:hypothetical protein